MNFSNPSNSGIELPTDSTRIFTDVNLEREGYQRGYLGVPISTNESAYGRIQVPIICIKNGDGPSVLLVAGNHGDEYEGQIALMKLACSLKPKDIRGRIIFLSAANLPAVQAGRRNSPLDGGNLNRSFPGRGDGSPTEMIAHYIEHFLVAQSEWVIDLHSGGFSLVYTPCALVRKEGNIENDRIAAEALQVFGAPIGYISDGKNGGGERTLAAAAQRCGAICITAELGGGGTIRSDLVALAENGVRRILCYCGALQSAAPAPERPPRLMEVCGPDYYVFAPQNGLIEPLADLGDVVTEGRLAALLYAPERPWDEPTAVTFRHGGTVICKRGVGRASQGDCLYQIATDCKTAN